VRRSTPNLPVLAPTRATVQSRPRITSEQRFLPPFCAVKVTGALFHTQGGLAIDAIGRVKRKDGTMLPNLFAAGGAAAGISGTAAAGYLSGNGLLTATVLGRSAGEAAAALVSHTLGPKSGPYGGHSTDHRNIIGRSA
jgi:predicted oxidoreductase